MVYHRGYVLYSQYLSIDAQAVTPVDPRLSTIWLHNIAGVACQGIDRSSDSAQDTSKSNTFPVIAIHVIRDVHRYAVFF